MTSAMWFGVTLASLYALFTAGSLLTALGTFLVGAFIILIIHIIFTLIILGIGIIAAWRLNK